jgi:DNA polymerase III subunit epsilon
MLPPHRNPIHREKAIRWAKQMAADDSVLFLDTETTGLNWSAEIVDLALIDRHGNPLLDTLIKPNGRIPPDASAVHGIHERDVINAPTWKAIYPTFMSLIENRQIVAYNQEFDRRMIDGSCLRCRLESPVGKWRCAMLAFSWFLGEWNPAKNDYRWPRLEEAVRFFRGAPGGHRALSDALACRQVVLGMANWDSKNRG